ncbi:MAG: rRNA pseudouridine synthase [Clostridia bacterium]|nr:rRNA pseudouridine synthase [Clostridia bacterium]
MAKQEPIRINKFLAECGVASRRGAEDLIITGKVKINGKVAELSDKVIPGKARVEVSGKRVALKSRSHVYIMMNKPRGYVTTMSDERGRKCVADLLKDVKVRVFPVGRLDMLSEGLLLLTDDGDFANRLTHPSFHIGKTYKVVVRGALTEDQQKALAEGIELDGKKTAPAEVSVSPAKDGRQTVHITIYEGKNREIRRMCEVLGVEVLRLKRERIGNLSLGLLPCGKCRYLTEKDIRKIFAGE